MRGTRWRPGDAADHQVEADCSWYLGQLVEQATAVRRTQGFRALEAFVAANPPQLIAEVEWGHADRDKPAIYRTLGVIELWRLDMRGDRLAVTVLDLQVSAGPRPAEQSLLLPGPTQAVIAAAIEADSLADMQALLVEAGIGTEPDPGPDDLPRD